MSNNTGIRPSIRPQATTSNPLDFHGTPLTISWLLIIDLAVFIAAVRWQKYSFYIHVVLALLVIGLTLAATIPMLERSFITNPRSSDHVNAHRIIGFIVVIWMGVQGFAGIFSRTIQFPSRVKPIICLWVKRIHRISGYLVMVLAKSNYLHFKFRVNKQNISGFVLLLIADVVLILLYIWIKYAYWTLSQETVDPQIRQAQKNKIVKQENLELQNKNPQNIIPTVDTQRKLDSKLQNPHQFPQKLKVPLTQNLLAVYTSEKSISLDKYVLFNDFVYETGKFQYLHPGGEYLIKLMNKRQVNRFLYGMYAPQIMSTFKKHNHTRDSIRLCGRPMAKIQRNIPIIGLQNYNKVMLNSINPIIKQSSTYVVHLKINPQNRARFLGFQDQSQIGQYFSLIISNQNGWNRVTRLYTAIWSMRPNNILLMRKIIPEFNNIMINNQKAKPQLQYVKNFESMENFSDEIKYDQQTIIPLVIKKYVQGQLTPRLLGTKFDGQIVLSKPMGAGIGYQDLPLFGKVVIVCGGTGLLPFCDFIDLLFKRVKYLEADKYSNQIMRSDPIVANNLIRNRRFKVYCAAENQNDLLPLTLNQLDYLSDSCHIKFECIFRIRNYAQQFSAKYKHITLQNDYFNQNIVGDLKMGEICKIYICGSPQMNESIGKLMVQNNVSQQDYHFM